MRRGLLLVLWWLGDLVLFVGAYTIAYVVRIGWIDSTDFPIEPFIQTTLIVAVLWLLVLTSFNVFRLTRVQFSLRNIAHIVYSCIIATALFALAYYFLFQLVFSRLLLVMAGALSCASVLVWHIAFDQWQRRVLRKNPPAYPLLIVGANRDAERLITLLNEKQSVFRPVAILDSTGTATSDIAGVPVEGKLNKLEETIKKHKITHLAQCAELEHTINLLSVCRQHGITYFLLPSVLGIVEGDETVELLEGKQAVTMVTQPKGTPWFVR